MKLLRRLFPILALSLVCLAGAAQALPSSQDARVEQLLREPVGPDPTAQLPLAEVMTVLGHRAQADALRGALLGLWIRRVDGEPADPALTVGGLLAQPTPSSPLTADSPLAEAWAGAVARHVQLRFLDEQRAAGQVLPVDARSGLEQVAPGLWASPGPVGSMILLVTVHQGQAMPLLVTRLHVAWLDSRLTCTPARGRGAREADVVFACEGTSHAASLPALRKAVLSTPGPSLAGGVGAGEFDTPTTTSAWIDTLAADNDVDLKRLLARAAPCEAERDAARRCVWSGPNAPQATDRGAATSRDAPQARETPRSNSDERSLLGEWIPKLGGWFFGGAIAMWFICGWLRSSSMLVECVVHVVATLALLFVAKWALIIGWAAWIHQHQSEVLAGTAGAFAIFVSLAAGMVVGATLHLMRRIYDWWLDNHSYQ